MHVVAERPAGLGALTGLSGLSGLSCTSETRRKLLWQVPQTRAAALRTTANVAYAVNIQTPPFHRVLGTMYLIYWAIFWD
jgi:hypothetical protein